MKYKCECKKPCLVSISDHWIRKNIGLVSNSPMFHACEQCPYDVANCWKHCSSLRCFERPCLTSMFN